MQSFGHTMRRQDGREREIKMGMKRRPIALKEMTKLGLPEILEALLVRVEKESPQMSAEACRKLDLTTC